MAKENLCSGHKERGKWILVPVSDIVAPKAGRICFGEAWWRVTDNDEVLFFHTYGSPQCNRNEYLLQRMGIGFDAPNTTIQYLGITFLPHRCSDYC